MGVEKQREDSPSMMVDELSMERSKSFVKALQELKNLRPQLYSAAEYGEKSYLHTEQKQMVLDNLKDYAVRALVNAVDHLGTVAYKLTDILEQQRLEVSTAELKVSCLNHKILTCQTYTNSEGIRQQRLLGIIPRHHKHYILPNSVNKKVHFSPHIRTDARQTYFQARPRLQPSSIRAAKSLSWHLASETKPTLKGTAQALTSSEDQKAPNRTSAIFHLPNNADIGTKSSAAHQLFSGGPAPNVVVTCGDTLDNFKPLTTFRSFDNPDRQIIRAPFRSKSMLSAFFVKHKSSKLRAGSPI